MSFQYSQHLIDELIDYFREEYGEILTPEQANDYLDSYAGLFLALADDKNKRD
jgi:hypothetical protein